MRISCPRIWHGSWETDLQGHGSLSGGTDGARCWQRKRRENWALCSSFVSKNTLHFSHQVSGDTIYAESTSGGVVCNCSALFRSCRRALQRRAGAG